MLTELPAIIVANCNIVFSSIWKGVNQSFACQAGVDGVAQGVADEVVTEHGEEDGDAGRIDHVGGGADGVIGLA